MKNLTVPGVQLQFTEKILSTLLRYCENGPLYVRMFVFSTSSPLPTDTCKMLYLEALSQVSASSALDFVVRLHCPTISVNLANCNYRELYRLRIA